MTTNYLIPEQIWNRIFDPETNSIKIAPLKEWNSLTATKPDSMTEVYSFFKDATLVETVTITYEDASKEFISSLVRA